jgi:hypothetical protein
MAARARILKPKVNFCIIFKPKPPFTLPAGDYFCKHKMKAGLMIFAVNLTLTYYFETLLLSRDINTP